MQGSAQGPRDGIEDASKPWEGEWLKPWTQNLKAQNLPGVQMEKRVHQGKGRKKPTDAALGSSLPCQGASAAAPPPAPLLAPPSEEAKVRVLGLIGKTETTSPRLPCTGFCKEDVTASTGQGPAETQDQPCSPAPNRSARAAGERPSPFDSCKGGWDTITQGSLNGTCVRFDKGKPWLLTIRREGQRQNSPRGSSPKTSAHGKPGPNQRTPKA